MSALGEDLAQQLERYHGMFRNTVGRFTDDDWRAGERSELVPARWALHTVEAIDFYAQATPDGFSWGERFAADWEGAPAEALPSSQQVLEYADEVVASLAAWLRSASDEELAGENAFPWTGASVTARMLYVLRHSHHHLGELCMILRGRGIGQPDWQ